MINQRRDPQINSLFGQHTDFQDLMTNGQDILEGTSLKNRIINWTVIRQRMIQYHFSTLMNLLYEFFQSKLTKYN